MRINVVDPRPQEVEIYAMAAQSQIVLKSCFSFSWLRGVYRQRRMECGDEYNPTRPHCRENFLPNLELTDIPVATFKIDFTPEPVYHVPAGLIEILLGLPPVYN
jgi:hypothetical protein